MLPKSVQKHLAFFIAPKSIAIWGIIENLLFTACIVLMGVFLTNEDPLYLVGLRWVFLCPVIFALRYGSMVGAFSVFTLFLTWLIFHNMGYYPDRELPQSQYIGTLVLTIIAGEFADFWRARLGKAESEAVYILEKLESLTKRHVVLRLSHDRLEENLLSRPNTVRDMLLELRNITAKQADGVVLPGAAEVLDLIADYCQVKRAAIYPIENEKLITTAVATLGKVGNINKDDELIKYSLEFKRLAHIQMERDKPSTYKGPYLACAPIANSNGEIIALLTIEQLPFLSVNYDNLQLLTVLLGLYADLIHNREAIQELKQRWPSMSYLFAQEAIALGQLQLNAPVESSLVILKTDGSEISEQVIRMLVDKRRSLDVHWNIKQQPSVIILLLPMTGPASFTTLENYWQEQVQTLFLAKSLPQAGITYAHRLLTEEPIIDQIDRMQQIINEH